MFVLSYNLTNHCIKIMKGSNNLFKNIDMVKHVAERLMLRNLWTTSEEVNYLLNNAGFESSFMDVEMMMAWLAYSNNWKYAGNDEEPYYSFRFDISFQLTPETPAFSLN